jgi:hypothetical protein
MLEVSDIDIEAGEIRVESFTYEIVRDDSFIIYINTVEKYVGVDSYDDCSITLFVNDDTRRHGELIGTVDAHKSTELRFPENWIVHAQPGRYAIRVIGVRR